MDSMRNTLRERGLLRDIGEMFVARFVNRPICHTIEIHLQCRISGVGQLCRIGRIIRVETYFGFVAVRQAVGIGVKRERISRNGIQERIAGNDGITGKETVMAGETDVVL